MNTGFIGGSSFMISELKRSQAYKGIQSTMTWWICTKPSWSYRVTLVVGGTRCLCQTTQWRPFSFSSVYLNTRLSQGWSNMSNLTTTKRLILVLFLIWDDLLRKISWNLFQKSSRTKVLQHAIISKLISFLLDLCHWITPLTAICIRHFS